MKIKYLFCFILAFSFLCIAQENEKAIILNKYLDTLKNYQVNGYSKFMSMNDKEFNHIMKEVYEAIEIASPEIMRNNDINMHGAKNYFLRAVQDRYSYIIKNLIRIPVFVKAKILSSRIVYKSGFGQINLTLKPEYVVKGKEPFLKQPEFEVFYREYEYVPKEKDYKIGKSYLFPLWYRGPQEDTIFAIATFIDGGHHTRFLVENNVLHDDVSYFGMGTEVKWDNFVKNINEMIYSIIHEKGLDKYKVSGQQERYFRREGKN
jgi:hypothetical protein